MLNRILLIVAISAFMTTACLDSGETPTKDGPSENKAEAEAKTGDDPVDKVQASDAGICGNEFYPIDTSVERKYKETGDVSAKYELSQETTGEDSFSEVREFESGMKITVNWLCTEDGLRTAEFNSSADFSKGAFKMATLESSGVTLPKEWAEGKKWQAVYKVKGELSAGPVKGSADGTVTVNSKIVSLKDSVKVAGGEFEAARVDVEIKMDLSMRGRKIPSRPMKMSNWYSKDVGLVKQTASTQFGKTGIEYTGKK
ncbi:MAG: hypothetical protein HKN33_07835 [Pyrinomonadaceae bacterium]|nr:hypothetical protein [Pyrinomonadaceae bacterium]